MEIEELMKQLAQGGINVQGDLVMKKEVQYEVSNVEAGGIGIQVVNGNPADMAGVKQTETKEADAEASEKDLPEKRTPGPRKHFLFIEGDASWEKEGKRRNTSKENTVVCHRERDRLLKFLKKHNMGSRTLTTEKDDKLNSIVVSFLIVWRANGWISKDFSGNAVHRFLHDECGIRTDVNEQSYANKIKMWMKDKNYSHDILAEVEEYMKTDTQK